MTEGGVIVVSAPVHCRRLPHSRVSCKLKKIATRCFFDMFRPAFKTHAHRENLLGMEGPSAGANDTNPWNAIKKAGRVKSRIMDNFYCWDNNTVTGRAIKNKMQCSVLNRYHKS